MFIQMYIWLIVVSSLRIFHPAVLYSEQKSARRPVVFFWNSNRAQLVLQIEF